MSHSHHGHMFGSSDQADSAGQPWEGREFTENPFAGDNGETPEQLAHALQTFRSLEIDSPERARAHADIIDALRTARLLVPLIAEAGDLGVTDSGLVVDKTQELAIVTVVGPDGQRVLPVFTSVAAMQKWNAEARPVPVEARRAALAAAADNAEWIVLDPQSPTELVLRRPVIAAIAQDLPWKPNHIDPELQAIFDKSIEDEPAVQAIRLTTADPDARGMGEELVVQIVLVPDLDRTEVDRIVQAITTTWSVESIFSQRVDSMLLKLIAGQLPD